MSKQDKSSEESISEKRAKGLELAIGALEKQFGHGTIVSGKAVPGVTFTSSGCLGIDRALGGGFGVGRIVEIYGPESSGKTTLALHAVAEIQKNGGTAAIIDVEHALDPTYAARLGVDINKIVLSQPDSGEQALEIIDTLASSGSVDLIVLDSVAALVPQKELEGEMGDAVMGAQARLMSQAMRKLTGVCSKTGCTLIFINQLRMKIGVMFGNPETTPGGNALKYYASQRIDIRRSGVVKNGTGDEAEVIGSKANIKVIKNKLAPPFKECEITIRYGYGIDRAADTLRLAVAAGVIQQSGSWYSYGDQRIGQGAGNVEDHLRASPELLAEIEGKIV